VIGEARAALRRGIDQAARRPAGRSSPESLHAVANEPVERHEDDLEAGDGARAFFGLAVGFLGAPLGVPAMAAAELPVVETSSGGGTTPAGCSKSAEDKAMRVSCKKRTRAPQKKKKRRRSRAREPASSLARGPIRGSDGWWLHHLPESFFFYLLKPYDSWTISTLNWKSKVK